MNSRTNNTDTRRELTVWTKNQRRETPKCTLRTEEGPLTKQGLVNKRESDQEPKITLLSNPNAHKELET